MHNKITVSELCRVYYIWKLKGMPQLCDVPIWSFLSNFQCFLLHTMITSLNIKINEYCEAFFVANNCPQNEGKWPHSVKKR